MTETYSIAFFDRATDNRPKPKRLTLPELDALLTAHEFRTEKDGPLFSPTEYSNGKTRANANVVALTLAVGDFDRGDVPPERVRDHLAGLGLAFWIYSTHSSAPDHPKFRAVVPLLAPVPASRWGEIWPALVHELFFEAVDVGTRDAARIFYLPSAPPGSLPFAYRGAGAAFDWTKLRFDPGLRRAPLTRPGETSPIMTGERRPKLMSIAGRLRNAGAGYDAILADLREANKTRCVEKLAERELAHIAASACRYEPGASMPTPAQADPGAWAGKDGWADEPPLLINKEQKNVGTAREPKYVEIPVEDGYVVYNQLISEHGFRPFRTITGEPRIAIPTGFGVDVRNPKDEDFEEFVGYRYYTLRGKRVPTREVKVAALALAGRSLSPELPAQRVLELAIRFAKTGEYESLLDLGTPDRRCVRVSPEGWAVETVSMPIFDRPAHLAPLPMPERGGGLDAALRLFEFVLVGLQDSEGGDKERAARLNGQRLLILVSEIERIVRPKSPKPAPVATGDEGAGKSSAAERYVAALDPSVVVHLPVPKDEAELLALAMNRATVSFDNVSSIDPWFSDGLARLVTGTGFAKRRLYTDRDEVVSRLIPQVVLNGITANPRYADLIRRCLFLWIEKAQRPKSEDDLSREWNSAHPAILGGLLDLAAGTLKELRDAPLSDGDGDETMADFVRVGRALNRAIGDRLGSFDTAWKENRARQETASAENPWISALFSAFDAARKRGEAMVTPEEIAKHVSTRFPESFPEKVSAQQVGNAIARCHKSLAALGIALERRKSHDGQRCYALVVPPSDKSGEAPESGVPPAKSGGASSDSPSEKGGSGGTLDTLDTHSGIFPAGTHSPPPLLDGTSSSRIILERGVRGVQLEGAPSEKAGGTSGGTTEAPRLGVPPDPGPDPEDLFRGRPSRADRARASGRWSDPPLNGDVAAPPAEPTSANAPPVERARGEAATRDLRDLLRSTGSADRDTIHRILGATYAPAEISAAIGAVCGAGLARQEPSGVLAWKEVSA